MRHARAAWSRPLHARNAHPGTPREEGGETAQPVLQTTHVTNGNGPRSRSGAPTGTAPPRLSTDVITENAPRPPPNARPIAHARRYAAAGPRVAVDSRAPIRVNATSVVQAEGMCLNVSGVANACGAEHAPRRQRPKGRRVTAVSGPVLPLLELRRLAFDPSAKYRGERPARRPILPFGATDGVNPPPRSRMAAPVDHRYP